MTNEVSFTRKIKEALLALKIERTYSKDKILELYLNEIYLGLGAYGIAAASLTYFDKVVNELTVPEAAYLAALPKAPNNYHPFRQRERAIERRNWVIDQMAADGFIKTADAEKAKRTPLGVTQKATSTHTFAAEYFAEEVRREIYDRYGEKKLYEGGLSVRTTLDTKLQVLARKALTDGLVHYDEQQGWRGPVAKIDISGDWGVKLADVKALNDVAPWRLAVVLETGDQSARIGLQPEREPGGAISKERDVGIIPLDGVKWAKVKRQGAGKSQPGAGAGRRGLCRAGQARRPVPAASGTGSLRRAWWWRIPGPGACSPWSAASPTTRASSTARRKRCASPAPSFKPIVYAAALDNGYTPSTLVLDAPIEIDQGPGLGVWKPENYERNFYGPSTLRFGIEHSRNVMTVRLAQDVGMPLIAEYAKRFGVYDDLPPYLSFAFGAGETTLLRMVTAYAMFDNGGRRVQPDADRSYPGPLRPHRLSP